MGTQKELAQMGAPQKSRISVLKILICKLCRETAANNPIEDTAF